MDKREASALLAKELDGWRQWSYTDLASRIDGKPLTGEVISEEGVRYQFELQVFWDDKRGGDLRVLGVIDDGGIRAFVPLTDDFIMTPDGSFIGEDTAQ